MTQQEAADPYATFRPRRGRVVPAVVAVIVLIAFGFAAATIPGTNWMIWDRLFLFAVGCAIAWFLSRFIGIQARPSAEGLTIRNLFITSRYEWNEILRMQFGGGSPWAYLDLASTETVAVMAIQKADGDLAQREAARMAALIEYHSNPIQPGSPDDH